MRISRVVSLLRWSAFCALLGVCPALVFGQTPPCVSFPAGVVPFPRIDYVSLPNSSGDRLVVGTLASVNLLSSIPLPSATNQRFCAPVELAPGLAAIAYVPTAAERAGDFAGFAGILVDPLTNPSNPLRGSPFPAGRIPVNRFPFFAWRIAAGAVGDHLTDTPTSDVCCVPDLFVASATVTSGQLRLTVHFGKGTFDPQRTEAVFFLDTDRNPNTGHPGVNAAGTEDRGIIGSEFLVFMGSAFHGNLARIVRYAGAVNSFVSAGTATASFFTDRMETTIPLSLIGDEGDLNFKIIVDSLISGSSFTTIQDYLPDLGSSPGRSGVASAPTITGVPPISVPKNLAPIVYDPQRPVVTNHPIFVNTSDGRSREVEVRAAPVTGRGAWLSVVPERIVAPAQVTVTVNPAFVGQGTFLGVITYHPVSSEQFPSPAFRAIPGDCVPEESTVIQLTDGAQAPVELSLPPGGLSFSSDALAAKFLGVSSRLNGQVVQGTPFNITTLTQACPNWLALDPQANSTTSANISVGVSPAAVSQLPDGDQRGFIAIEGPQNSQLAEVTLTVTKNTAALELGLQSGSITFRQEIGSPQAPEPWPIFVSGEPSFVPLPFQATHNCGSWLTITQTAASTPAHLILAADPSQVNPQQNQHCVLAVTSTLAGNPESVSVNLEFVAGALPSLEITRMLPHVVEGNAGEWRSTLILANTSNNAAGFQLDLRDDAGNDLFVPFGSSGTLARVTRQTLPANATFTTETDGTTAAFLQGWAELFDSTGTGVIDGTAIFRRIGNPSRGLVDSEAAVPITVSSANSFFLPFDNTTSPQDGGAFQTGVALVSPSLNAVGNLVSVFLYDENGFPINPAPGENRVIELSRRGHRSFAFGSGDFFPSAAGRRGLARFVSESPESTIAGLGLRFSPFNTFTSLPILERAQTSGTLPITQMVSHIPGGSDWQTTIILANTSTTPAIFRLAFRDNNGQLRAVPITGEGDRAEVGGTINGLGVRIYQIPGRAGLTDSWATLEAPASIGGTAIFRWLLSGRDFEGAVPIVPVPPQNRPVLLPFDNREDLGLGTGIALANASAAEAAVTVAFYDSNGVEIAPATGESRRVILRALGHDAFALGDRFPSVRNRQGLARFTSTGSSISGLGLRFNGRVSTFTSLPTLRGR